MYASAVMGTLDTSFVSEYGDYVDSLMHDVSFKSNKYSEEVAGELFFPLSRHKSYFDGHSFASGLFPFATGKSQESSSEAVNCYYGAYLWSQAKHRALGDAESAEYVDFARLLLAMEIRGAQMYWHMVPSLDAGDATENGRTVPQIYTEEYTKNIMVGNLGMLNVISSTWFGSSMLYVHMIQFLPATAITTELWKQSFVEIEYPDLLSKISQPISMDWRGYVISDHSFIDPTTAWNDAQDLDSAQLDTALSKTQVLNFISRQHDGLVAKSYKSDATEADDNNSSASASCQAHPACASLAGLCCPTPTGVRLQCCN
mmetsp:Transcript_24036/g.56077  ORF Transcript_24036/g.56077 Transcript_24036/m.56077 type:complete len:315 (-) Transcript_24036:271-1215(-)|eukprot:CAMPEP_0116831264 /NCGR_PEP_ID=MMETSP0418-20121206/5240_1 /TAXON_ID=1158023 /ORGANISM="Astrosyne radiata, Strain 13vi08-1A" /LENGTH=314 /DNA_ID=CAMNT_0004460495 /DNA_START=110 /DNA_END=1054 /DNA_ORIENTATION=-